ncbi:MAG: molybdopterin-synthase adenylyltransferase MoeB [Gemmatimonadota bacterium]|mgnify:FL=1
MTSSSPTGLSTSELLRYARHLTLPQVGVAGQLKLRASRLLLVGAGGLGSPAALYLAAAGVGTIGIIDPDRVDRSNLQRQVLHGTSSIGELKTRSAERRLRDLNPEVRIERIEVALSSANALELVSRYDLVLDGSDNFPTRYLVNDACVLTGKPYIYGSIFRFDGQVSVFAAPGGPCYRCLYAEPPAANLIPTCAESGVLGVVPGIIGSLQALEAIKWITGIGQPLVGRLLLFEGLGLTIRELRVQPDPSCAACGSRTLTELIDYQQFCGVVPQEPGEGEIVPADLARTLGSGPGNEEVVLLDVREAWEREIAMIGDSVHIPLSRLGDKLAEIDPRKLVITYCHRGSRAVSAREILLAAGFREVKSLAGGIDGWAEQQDSAMKRY